MLNCLTYMAFVYWAVATVHTILPIDVAVCGADRSRGGRGSLLHHSFGGDVDLDVRAWQGFPCNSHLLAKFAFILQRPGATVRHIMSGGGQDEPFVPILFIVPLMFLSVTLLRRLLGLRLMSETAARTMLKLGVAVGCRGVILLQSILEPGKHSLYYKRYSKVEFFIVTYTAYIIELPVWHETLVSGGTLVSIVLMCALFPGHMLPEVNPWNVALQGIAGAGLAVAHAAYQQRRRLAEQAARAARSAAKVRVADPDAAAATTSKTVTTTEEAGTSAKSTTATTAATTTATTTQDATCAEPPRSVRPSAAAAAPGAVSSVAASVEVLRRINSFATRSYVSPARPCRFSIKVQQAHLADLPPNLMSVINTEVLAGSGWQAVSAYAREGCVELVLDLRPVLAARVPYGGGGDAAADDSQAIPDQDQYDTCDASPAVPAPMDEAALRDLGRSIVSYLHTTGVIRPERESSVVLQMDESSVVVTWQPDLQAWVVDGDDAPPPAAAAPVSTRVVPELQHVTPRVAAWPGVAEPLRLTAVICGPSAEEVLAGGGLVIRGATCPLPYSVLRVTFLAPPSPPPSPGLASPPQSPQSPPTPLLVELAVGGLPSSGMLKVEARSSAGLLSTALAVVVDHDEDLVAGLAALLVGMDEASADALLLDYGMWLDAGAAEVHSAREAGTGGKAGIGGYSGKDVLATAGCAGGGADMPRVSSGTILASIAGPAAAMPYVAMPYLDLSHELRDRGPAGAGPCQLPLLSATMLAIGADLLTVCCQSVHTDPAAAAVVDRLIAVVLACDGRPAAAALTDLLAAVPSPPTNAGVLHLAMATGSRPVAEVLLRWYERLLGGGGGGAAAVNPWLCRANSGVTPLHVAAAMPDGGAMAAWALDRYPAAAAAWRAATSDDGLTPAALAARLGGRWRLRLWHASRAVQAVRRALAPSAPLGHAAELLWGFQDGTRERRYAATVSGQTVATLALYAAFNTLLPLLSLTEAVMDGSFKTVLAALAFHVPHTAPLLAWLCVPGPRAGNIAAAGAQQQHRSQSQSQQQQQQGARWWAPAGHQRASGVRLQRALLAMHLCRAVAKVAVGLSLWPFALSPGATVFLTRGGDIAMEAVVRPLLEQVGLSARLLVSLADAPAMFLLYRGLKQKHPEVVPRPLERVLLYQVVLLATTAAISATNRVRFHQAEQARAACMSAATSPSPAPGPAAASASAGASAGGGGSCRGPTAAATTGSAGGCSVRAAVCAGSGARGGGGGDDQGSNTAGCCSSDSSWARRKGAMPSAAGGLP